MDDMDVFEADQETTRVFQRPKKRSRKRWLLLLLGATTGLLAAVFLASVVLMSVAGGVVWWVASGLNAGSEEFVSLPLEPRIEAPITSHPVDVVSEQGTVETVAQPAAARDTRRQRDTTTRRKERRRRSIERAPQATAKQSAAPGEDEVGLSHEDGDARLAIDTPGKQVSAEGRPQVRIEKVHSIAPQSEALDEAEAHEGPNEPGEAPAVVKVARFPVEVRGDAQVRLRGSGEPQMLPDSVEAGQYGLDANFGGDSWETVGQVTVDAERKTTIVCNARMANCRVLQEG